MNAGAPPSGSDSSVAPCVYPGCRDGEGNPRLTRDVMCPGCRNRYRRLLGWLVEDYSLIRVSMPRPVGVKSVRRSRTTSFGHPAAWASDMLAEIAEVLNAVEDNLREHNGHGSAPEPVVSEPVRVRHAVTYLTDRFDDLCTFPDASDVAAELHELHRSAYVGLGMTRFVEKLPVPCPDCGLARMVRTVGQVYCQACGCVFPDDQYPRLALIVAADVAAERDKRLAEWLSRHTQPVSPA